MGNDEFGKRMKEYEFEEMNDFFLKDMPLIVRIDGRSFSRYTKKFNKPFDDRINNAMCHTALSVYNETNAQAVYYQSDEINLVYPVIENPLGERDFGGKKVKIISNYASLATGFFNDYMHRNGYNTAKPAFFDCRAFHVPDNIEAANNILWRMHDAKRNGVSCLYRYTHGHKKMNNKSSKDMIIELGDLYTDTEHRFTFGEFWTRNFRFAIDIPSFMDYDMETKVNMIF